MEREDDQAIPLGRGDDQPDLSDIHVLLKDLQKSMINEVTDIKSSFKKQETELRTAKEALNAALKYSDQLKTELKATKKRVNEQEDEIDELYESIDTPSSTRGKIPSRLLAFQKMFVQTTTKMRFESEDTYLQVSVRVICDTEDSGVRFYNRSKHEKDRPLLCHLKLRLPPLKTDVKKTPVEFFGVPLDDMTLHDAPIKEILAAWRDAVCRPARTRNDVLRIVSEKVGHCWKKLVRELNFTEEKIDMIPEDANNDKQECCHKALQTWRQENGEEATIRKLMIALNKAGLADVNSDVIQCLNLV
ncbi:Ankyrin-2 [Desmophyllum pertusum]|uniref:Ankyrin-2 n=1 Tax=Desmophyllum pertusum TaxID=174260 RepID=A0A9W9ZYJ2_9CNID|nr:Ankyrin-2 [Desmophyllum pertusum]